MPVDRKENGAETRPELPDGFKWKEIPYCKAAIPMPVDWHFFTEPTGWESRSFFISREKISGNPVALVGDTLLVPVGKAGFFQTGFTMHVFKNAPSVFEMKPSEFVRQYLEHDIAKTVTSEPVYTEDGAFLTGRGRFISDIGGPGSKFYADVEVSGNDTTGALYMLIFESPEQIWQEDKDIARVMLEQKVLSQSF